MKLSEYSDLDALALAAAIQRGDFTPAEVIEASIAAIDAINPALNAVVMKNFDNARVRASADIPQGPLAGVPFLAKDVNVFTADMPTTFSCRFFDGVAPRADSEMVRRWRAAGLVILGKSNTPEFAEDYVCESTFRGAALNPWDTGITTGGSSGGAGAAVASGMVPLAHGTDLGGSIRIPAACCGVFGLKPSTGLCPVDASRQELASGFNSDHVLTRSVRDSAAVLDLTAFPITGARYPVQRSVASYLECLQQPLASLRIGVCTTTPTGWQTPARQVAAVDKAAAILSAHGHELVEYAYPTDVGYGDWMDLLWMFDVVHEIERRSMQLGRKPDAHELEAMTAHILTVVGHSDAMAHYDARRKAHQASVKLMNSMTDIDVLMTPALGSEPVALGELDSRTEAFDYTRWIEQGTNFAPFSYVCNVTGQPAASIPVPLEDSRPPAAVQLAGQSGQDHRVLQISALLEEELSWAQFRPPIWASD